LTCRDAGTENPHTPSAAARSPLGLASEETLRRETDGTRDVRSRPFWGICSRPFQQSYASCHQQTCLTSIAELLRWRRELLLLLLMRWRRELLLLLLIRRRSVAAVTRILRRRWLLRIRGRCGLRTSEQNKTSSSGLKAEAAMLYEAWCACGYASACVCALPTVHWRRAVARERNALRTNQHQLSVPPNGSVSNIEQHSQHQIGNRLPMSSRAWLPAAACQLGMFRRWPFPLLLLRSRVFGDNHD
jgi:hypothetical protein